MKFEYQDDLVGSVGEPSSDKEVVERVKPKPKYASNIPKGRRRSTIVNEPIPNESNVIMEDVDEDDNEGNGLGFYDWIVVIAVAVVSFILYLIYKKKKNDKTVVNPPLGPGFNNLQNYNHHIY